MYNNKSSKNQAVTKHCFRSINLKKIPRTKLIRFRRIFKNLFVKAHSLVNKFSFRPRIGLLNSQTSVLDGVETGVLLSDFAQQLRQRNSDILNLYFTLIDAAGISPSLVFNQNAETKEGGS